MTRINLVPVEELSDKHLSGEFHEISRVFGLARSLGKAHPQAPGEYTLGKGHVIFFYDKLAFIRDRYISLGKELDRRSVSRGKAPGVNWERVSQIITEATGEVPELFGWYTPTDQAISINRVRIAERS